MDFKTRDLYRKEIESLSFATGREEKELAEITIDLARANTSDHFPSKSRDSIASSTQIVDSPPGLENSVNDEKKPINPDRGRHIGEFLIGKGRAALEQELGYKPGFLKRFKRLVLEHASSFYLSWILILSIVLITTLWFAAQLPKLFTIYSSSPGNFPWSFTGSLGNTTLQWIIGLLISLSLLIPVLTVTTSLGRSLLP